MAHLGPTLDLACGRGRHALAAAHAGLPVIAIDRDAAALRALEEAWAVERDGNSEGSLACLHADLESGHEIPMNPGSCGSILVFRFLFRPLASAIVEALAPGGLLVYETFTRAQLDLGFGPKSDAFLLESGELPALFTGLETLEYSEGATAEERPSMTARLLARKP